jgi:uncharacterized protein
MRKPPNERPIGPRTPAKAGGQSIKGPRTPAKAGGQSIKGPRTPAKAGRQSKIPVFRGDRIPERKCVLTGARDARDNLIRLALSPDGEILPDVRARAPGRGAWIGVDGSALEKARANGKLKGALARAFKSGEIRIPGDLPARIEAALRQALLDRLGLEARAGTLLTGSERIEDCARKGEVRLLLHAEDASQDGNRRLDQALRVGTPGAESGPRALVIPAQRTILSLALGRQNVVHIALNDRAAAARVGQALDRWRAFIGPKAGLDAATAGTPDASAE